jgi:ubiquinone/menaquinone biosynthesis C-methylase UbiE
MARRKAAERGLTVEFQVKDAMKLGDWDKRFAAVIDSGLFHVFSDEDRVRYAAGLTHVTEPGGRLLLLCFSDEEPGTQGPRRVSHFSPIFLARPTQAAREGANSTSSGHVRTRKRLLSSDFSYTPPAPVLPSTCLLLRRSALSGRCP